MFDRNWNPSGESQKSYQSRIDSGFMHRYLSGSAILDIGGSGYEPNPKTITQNAVNIDLDYPGYDGLNLPFPDQSQDAVYSSHCLEHIESWKETLQEWFRVIKVHGYLVIIVPHQMLYEKKSRLPSRYNSDHKRFYLPHILLDQLEKALPKSEWRLRHCCENDLFFDYSIPPAQHSVGCYEIECVVEKIPPYQFLNELEST